MEEVDTGACGLVGRSPGPIEAIQEFCPGSSSVSQKFCVFGTLVAVDGAGDGASLKRHLEQSWTTADGGMGSASVVKGSVMTRL